MNTVEKGDKLEKIIFDIFSDDINNDRFWARKDCCKIFSQKGYYSKDREKDIIFDVSIEIYLPGEKSYSMLVLIECKNYNHRVPVDDVEEFYAKTQQVSGANIKAILASTNSYQEGAFKFSRSKGIGLLRYFSEDRREWILARSAVSTIGKSKDVADRTTVLKGLSEQDFRSKGFDFHCYSEGEYSNSTRQLIASLVLQRESNNEKSIWREVESKASTYSAFVKYLSTSSIESKCLEVLKQINYCSGAVSVEKLVQLVHETHHVALNFNVSLEAGVLGNISFEESVINIDNQQCETDSRARFTVAHELGHLFLKHSDYMLGERCLDSHLVSVERTDLQLMDVIRMEWQANQFAACLLLPQKAFLVALLEQIEKRGIVNRGFGLLFVDGQRCNILAMNSIASILMRRFKVSKTVVIIRMKQLGVLQESSVWFRDEV